jgi:phytoene dehydrogenase-like protein
MHVLIVGAGLGGLTCARELDRQGIQVTVVEASDDVGGRVRSDYINGYTLDRGFQVLFDAYPAVRRHIDLPALDLRPFDPGAIICFNGRRTILTDPLRDSDFGARLEAALSVVVSPIDKLRVLQLALELRNQTVDEVISGQDTTSLNFLRDYGFSERIINIFFRPFYGGVLLDRELKTSAKCLKFDFKMLAEGQTTVPARGIGMVSAQLAAPLLRQGRIRLNTAAKSLINDGNKVIGVQLVSGEAIYADAVVIATPAPDAARLSGLLMPQGAKQTMTLYFTGDTPFYQAKKLLLNAQPDAFVNNAQLLTNINPSYAPRGRHLLSATVIGVPLMSDTDIFKRALRDLQYMFTGDIQAQAALAAYQPLRLYRIPYAQFEQPPGIHPSLPDNRTSRKGLYFAAEFTEASSLNAAMVSGEKCAAVLLEDIASL